MARSAGVLLSISMLPNEFGIGGFGSEAIDFAKRIRSVGFKKWQILPLTTIGTGNSPYSGVSAFAGNYLFIDPKKLRKAELISDTEYKEAVYDGSVYTVNYEFVRESKRRLIEACAAKLRDSDAVRDFAEKEKVWLADYAEYMTIKECNGWRPWYEWDDSLKDRNSICVKQFIEQHADKYFYYLTEQYLFDSQWRELREEVNAVGVSIIGDMPIYVSHDSVDVWANRRLFNLDEFGRPVAVAGVPPDYFCAEGQLWGNPLYDYAAMRNDGYEWFVSRAERMSGMYDCLRIDHFRAFDRYWSVPYGSPNAVNGEWIKADGKQLLDTIKAKCPGLELIAEDLGIIDEGVTELRESQGIPGMRVLQFGLTDPTSTNCPHNFEKKTVAYTGTHDNTTTFAWLYELPHAERKDVYAYIGAPDGLEGGVNSPQVYCVIRCLMNSVADTVIVPFQDLCGWGSDTRFNIPGAADGNWIVRVTDNDINSISGMKYNELIRLSGRV